MIKNSLRDVVIPSRVDISGDGLSVLICTSYKHHFNWMAYASWYSVYKNLPGAKIAITCGRASKIDSYYYHWIYKANDLRYNLHKDVGEKIGVPYLNKLFGVYVALKSDLVRQPLVVLDADMMAVRDLSLPLVNKLNSVEFATVPCPYEHELNFSGKPVGPVWFFNRVPLETIGEAINTLKTLKGRDHLDLLALSKVFGDRVTTVEDLGCEVGSDEAATFVHYNKGCGNFIKKDWEKGKVMPPFNTAYALQAGNVSLNERKVIELWGRMAELWEVMNQIKL